MEETLAAWDAQLHVLHERIAGRFVRAEPRRRALAYRKGLTSPCERKNSWQLAELSGEASPDGVQRLLNQAHWDAAVRDDLHAYVAEHLGAPQSVLVVDETGFVKKGGKSVGLQRQYSGTAGRIENCQVGVFLAYASPKGSAFLDRALYLPDGWGDDPASPCAWVTGDSIYGGDRKLRMWLEGRGQPFVLAVPKNEPLWAEGFRQVRADKRAAQLQPVDWHRLSAGAGAKGPRLYDWARLKVHRLQLSPEEARWEHWLLVRRSVEEPKELAYYVVFGPAETPLEEMVRGGRLSLAHRVVLRGGQGGVRPGPVVEGDKRFEIAVRLPESVRANADALRALPIETPSGGSVTLGSLATLQMVPAPAQISRDHGKRRVVVQLNVRGTDLGTFVPQAQAAIAQKVKLPEGYYLEWGGQYENLQRAKARLTVVVPIALALIFVLLFSSFGSIKQSLLIFSGVPLAVTGGILGLWLRGLPFSISAGVGFIALSGVAVLNGVVMVSAINTLRKQGRTIDQAVREGARARLRPILMTALVAALGFIPMALNTGIGAEVQRPLATVVIGGIVSATLLTLVVLPILYTWFERESEDVDVTPTAPPGDHRLSELGTAPPLPADRETVVPFQEPKPQTP